MSRIGRLIIVGCLVFGTAPALAEDGRSIPGVSFQVLWEQGKGEQNSLAQDLAHEVIDAVVQALTTLVQQRSLYQRVDQALTNDLLEAVVIEPRVLNRDGKEFPFLVARTKHKGKVKLLINAHRLLAAGRLGQPDALAPRLAKEFQWVISKAATQPKRRETLLTRDLKHAPIHTNAAIQRMSPEERTEALHALLSTYMQTMDAYGSLTNQPYYETDTTTLRDPAQPDSTTKLYDMRVRQALQLIVGDLSFWNNTPKAVRSLLNGKVWHVLMVKIDERDWTTRTRVAPKDKAVTVGEQGRVIQPAKVLVNYHRALEPENDLYAETKGLPMGALSAEPLAKVIAWEIQNQIVEKSMRGHVAEDERTSPE